MNKRVINYYETGVEEIRFQYPAFQLELMRTQQIISGVTGTNRKLSIADVGGGSGLYSFWLKKKGHSVTYIDPIPSHVKNVNSKQETHGKLLKIIQADAMSLPLKSNHYDIVLLLGPLYHLIKKKERIKALNEAKRILKPGGALIAAGISRYASLMDGFARGIIVNADFNGIVDEDLKSGIHINKTGKNEYFTDSYFHTPEELKNETEDSGFRNARVVGVECFAWLLGSLDQIVTNKKSTKLLLKYLQKFQYEKGFVEVSAHLLVIASKQA